MRGVDRSRLGFLLIIVLVISLATSAWIVQQPLSMHALIGFGSAVLDVLAVVLLVIVSGAVGTLLMPDLPRLSILERESVRALSGLAAISLVMMIIGLAGLIPSRGGGWLVFLLALVVLRRFAVAWSLDTIEGLSLLFTVDHSILTRWLRWAVMAFLAMALLNALTPPTTWDAMTYHLVGPADYLNAGKIISIPDNHFLGFPQLVEMLFLWLMILARPQTAALLHWIYGVLLLMMLLGLTRRLRHPSAGWLAAAILLASTSIWAEFFWAYNDLALMAYVTGALVILQAIGEVGPGQQTRLLIWVGLFVGFAMSVKYTAAGAALGIGAGVIWTFRRGGRVAVLWALFTVIGCALIAFAPALIKNVMLDGNPISPFGWGTARFDEIDAWYYLRPGTGLSIGHLLAAPLESIIFGVEGRSPYQSTLSIFLVSLPPMVAIGWKQRDSEQRRLIAALLVFIIPAYLFWLYGAATSWFLAQTRLLFAILPALALIGALGVEGLPISRTMDDLRRMLRGIILILVGVSVVVAAIQTAEIAPLRVVSGQESEQDFLTRRMGAYFPAMQEVNRLPQSARVLTLWEPRSFYCESRCIPDSLISLWWHDRQLEPNPSVIAEQWRAQGVTHVLIHEAGLRFLYEEEPHEPLTAEDVAALDKLRAEEMTLIWEGYGAYTLYALNSQDSP